MFNKKFLLLFVTLMIFWGSNTFTKNHVLYAQADETLTSGIIENQDEEYDFPPEFWDIEPPEVYVPDPDDPDRDGLLNIEEENFNTDPNDPDSDNDGFTDGWEVLNGFDPNSPDNSDYLTVEDLETDDELTEDFNEEELDNTDDNVPPDIEIDYDSIPPSVFDDDKLDSNTLNEMEGGIEGEALDGSSTAVDLMPVYMLLLLNDNDNDGLDDDWEIRHFGSIDAYDGDDDPDVDGLLNIDEYRSGADPNNPDSDDDDLTDGWEFLNGLDPTSSDSDDDLMPDNYEVTNGLNPILDDARGNLDNDGFTNYQEYIITTDPNDSGDTPVAPDDVDLGFNYDEQQGGGGLVGETIRVFNGNVIEYRSDLSFSSPNQIGLSLEAFYNSKSSSTGSMGYGWTHTYEVFLDDSFTLGSLTLLKITDSTGNTHYFYEETTGEYGGIFSEKTYVKAEGGGYTWYLFDGTRYGFSTSGQLQWMDDPVGNRLQVTYDINEKLEKVTDIASGRELTFTYDGNGFLDYVAGPVTTAVADGKWVDYTITSQNLTSVTYADNSGFNYTYADANDIHNLTRKENKAGHLINTWAYNSSDIATSNYSREGKGVNLIIYQTSTQIDVTDEYGKIRSYYLTTSSTRKRVETITESGGRPGAFPWSSSNAVYWIYDNCMNPVEIEYAGGAVNLYENYDNKGNPGKVYFGWDDTGGTALRTIEYTYHPQLNMPLTRKEPSVLFQPDGFKETIWDYDDPTAPYDDPYTYNESPTDLPYAIIEKGYTKDSTGAIVSYAYTTRLTYNSKGQVLSINGPRPEVAGDDDLIEILYDTTTGDTTSITRPHIGVTSYSGYDAAGQVGTVTDFNLQSKTYTYDSRGRVTITTNNADSSISEVLYNNAGEISSSTDEDNVTTSYLYNDPSTDKGLLFKIVDSENNYIKYTYDDEGNLIEKGYYEYVDGTNDILTNKKNYVYQDAAHNMPGLLYKEINSDATESFTQYTYDFAGNVESVIDPEGKSTEYTYDDLNRLKTVTQHDDTVNIVTEYDYDEHGNLESVEDANDLTTEYQYDDMGRLVSSTSPDTGTVTYAYDESGNSVSKTDQKAITVTYEYDFLNRLTDVNFPAYETLAAYSMTYSYDSGTNGIGRRTGMSDPSGSTIFGYDNRGRLVNKTTTINSQNYTLSRSFTPGGRVDDVTYPSNNGYSRVIDFQRNGGCACKVTDIYTSYNTATNIPLFTSLDYRPFGGARSLSTGGQGSVDSTFDTTGRMTVSNPGATHEKTFTYDNLGNITSITGTSLSYYNRTYVYDDLYRLKSATGPWGSITYDYDNVGNRNSKTIEGVTDIYAYVTDTNIIDSITTSTGTIDYSNDVNGNITAIDDKTLIYDQNNRMIKVEDTGGTLGEYTYNGLGQRIIKEAGGTTIVFHYDFNGNIIGESDLSGNFTKEYIYKGSSRIALVDYSSESNGKIFFYGNDTLGTPLILTDSDNMIIWEASYKPFGEAEVNPNSEVENNFRFKGQYFDSETGFHYNYHRYYEPSIGRYLRADPIGLEGGINLFSYVGNNPINKIDPSGLLITKIEVCHNTAEVRFHSDIHGIITVPAALGAPSTPSPASGTTYYVRGMYKDPTNPKWQHADRPWDETTNPRNPFGPYIILIKDRNGNNVHKHIHGTSGGWGSHGDTSYLGGSDPADRHWTHGCVRTPNADLRDIYNEGVMINAPVEYKDCCP